jgi:hypothetical protein
VARSGRIRIVADKQLTADIARRCSVSTAENNMGAGLEPAPIVLSNNFTRISQ